MVLFVTEGQAFEAHVQALGRDVFPDRSLWIDWPKRSSDVMTDMTEDVIREVALQLGLVLVDRAGLEPATLGLTVQPDRLQRTAKKMNLPASRPFLYCNDLHRIAPRGDRPVRSAYAQFGPLTCRAKASWRQARWLSLAKAVSAG